MNRSQLNWLCHGYGRIGFSVSACKLNMVDVLFTVFTFKCFRCMEMSRYVIEFCHWNTLPNLVHVHWYWFLRVRTIMHASERTQSAKCDVVFAPVPFFRIQQTRSVKWCHGGNIVWYMVFWNKIDIHAKSRMNCAALAFELKSQNCVLFLPWFPANSWNKSETVGIQLCITPRCSCCQDWINYVIVSNADEKLPGVSMFFFSNCSSKISHTRETPRNCKKCAVHVITDETCTANDARLTRVGARPLWGTSQIIANLPRENKAANQWLDR
jgi:hypothetical protein